MIFIFLLVSYLPLGQGLHLAIITVDQLLLLLFNINNAKVELGSSCQIFIFLLVSYFPLGQDLHLAIITVDMFLIFLLLNNAKVELSTLFHYISQSSQLIRFSAPCSSSSSTMPRWNLAPLVRYLERLEANPPFRCSTSKLLCEQFRIKVILFFNKARECC